MDHSSTSDTASSAPCDGFIADGDVEWHHYRDDDIKKQRDAIQAEEAKKVPFIGDKEPLSNLAAEYEEGNVILKEKIKVLSESYSAIRRTQGDGNCFYRAFMFSYLEHILETKDGEEVNHVLQNIERVKQALLEQGYPEFTFEDFFAIFVEQLESVLGEKEGISLETLVERCRDQTISNYVVMFLRFVTCSEIRKRADFFENFIVDLTVDKYCKTSVEPMGEECENVHVIALSDAMGVPIRIVYLDRNPMDPIKKQVQHHDFVPTSSLASESGSESVEPFVVLLYRPGHYDILYPTK